MFLGRRTARKKEREEEKREHGVYRQGQLGKGKNNYLTPKFGLFWYKLPIIFVLHLEALHAFIYVLDLTLDF